MHMFHSLVHPQDYWVFIPSIMGIIFLGITTRFSRLGWLLLIGTTCYITINYSPWRGVLHAAIMYAIAQAVRYLPHRAKRLR